MAEKCLSYQSFANFFIRKESSGGIKDHYEKSSHRTKFLINKRYVLEAKVSIFISCDQNPKKLLVSCY